MSATSKMFIATIMAMAGISSMSDIFPFGRPDYKYSINEITEKSDVTKEELLELLEKGIIKGRIVFGVPYIIGDTPHSVEGKLKKFKEDL
jgi:hypothetical protein